MVPGALAERLGDNHYDVVIVNQQDPCTQDAVKLLERLAGGGRESLVFVTEPIERQGLQLILDLTGMWPQAFAKLDVSGGVRLGEALAQAGYRQQVIIARLLTVYSREAQVAQGAAAPLPTGPSEAEVSEVRQVLLQTFADAFDDGSVVDPQRNLANAGLSSMTWALIFAKLQQRFGQVIESGVFAELGAAPRVE